jgi:hypothetical protein
MILKTSKKVSCHDIAERQVKLDIHNTGIRRGGFGNAVSVPKQIFGDGVQE